MKAKEEKREVRTYKIKGIYYDAAFAKALKSNSTLAKEVEKFVTKYSGVK